MGDDTFLETVKSIVIVGVGGTGSFLLTQLVRYINSLPFAGKIEIVIVDGDKYEENNVDRQEFAHSRMGKNKADVQVEVYKQKFPKLKITSVPEYLGEGNIENVIWENSVTFCCVDNHVCRFLVSKHCQNLNDALLISGGNEEYDGNVQSFRRLNGENVNKPIEVRHPEIAMANDGDRSEMSCAELAELPGGGQVIFTNAMAASLMVQMLYAYESERSFMCKDGTVAKVSDINDIFFDIRQLKTLRIINNKPE